MEQKGFNGYANYETWAVSLWLSNDRHSYEYFRTLAHSMGRCGCRAASLTKAEANAEALADALRNEFEEHSPVRNHSTVYADLMNAALGEVDWHELARELLSEVVEEKRL